jgi:hypothetical protein
LFAWFWSSKGEFGLGLLDFERTFRPERWNMSICYGKASIDSRRRLTDRPMDRNDALPSTVHHAPLASLQ